MSSSADDVDLHFSVLNRGAAVIRPSFDGFASTATGGPSLFLFVLSEVVRVLFLFAEARARRRRWRAVARAVGAAARRLKRLGQRDDVASGSWLDSAQW